MSKQQRMTNTQKAAASALALHRDKLGDMTYDDQAEELDEHGDDLVCGRSLDELFVPIRSQLVAPLPAISWTIIANAVEEYVLTTRMYEFPADGGYGVVIEKLPELVTEIMRTACLAASCGLPSTHPYRQHAERMATATAERDAYHTIYIEEVD